MGDLLNVEVMVPLIVFISIVIMVAIPFYFRHRNRVVISETIKAIVEKTGTADPKLIALISAGNAGRFADLRKGVVLLCVAGALVGLAQFIPEDEAIGPLMGVAFFPGLIGAAYILFHFLAPRDTHDDAAD